MDNKKDNSLEAVTEEKDKKFPTQRVEEVSVPISPFSNIRRELSEADLNNPAVQRLLLSENDKLERKVHLFEKMESNYHVIDKDCAILREKLGKNNSFEVLYSFCLSVGSALAGISSIFWANKGYILLIVGLAMIVGGIASKLVRK